MMTPQQQIERSPELQRLARRHAAIDRMLMAAPSMSPAEWRRQCDETLRAIGVYSGTSIFSGFQGYSDAEAPSFAWSGNTNVNAWLTQDAYITDTSGDVDSWVSQQAYTSAGASTTYTFAQSGSARPAYSSAGDGSIAIDGTAEYLASTDADLLDLPEGDDTQIAVVTKVTLDSTGSGDHFWGWYLTSSNNPCLRFIRAGSIFRSDRFDNTGTSVTRSASENTVDGTTYVIVDRFRTSPSPQIVHEFDGSVDASSPQAADVGAMSGFDKFAIGASFRNTATPANLSGVTIEKGFFIVRNNDAVIADIVTWLQT